MRTAIVSDLHLGAASGEDVLRDAATRRVLLAEVADADRVVLLGDVVELRDQAIGPALARARPFFEELGEALGGREVTLVAGNHDHRFAEPLLDELSFGDGGTLGLECGADPAPGPTARIDEWLGPARLRIAYPGIWLRDDVYATHGHYMDLHLPVPRAECLAAATLLRLAGPLPGRASVAEYERVLRPIYGFAYGAAQARPRRAARRQGKAFEVAWEVLAGEREGGSRRQQLNRSAIRTGFPIAVAAVNRLLHSDFDPDVSGDSIFRGGLEAASELAVRLGVDGVHVINGHTHRAGPLDGEEEWNLPGGGRLHNTGSWCFASAFHHPGTPPGPYWPGTVTWVEEEGPPRLARLLMDRSHAELVDLIAQAAAL
jgi:Calcineurin-like phosphoesterase superfamily domain